MEITIASFGGLYPSKPARASSVIGDKVVDADLARGTLRPFHSDAWVMPTSTAAQRIYDLAGCCVLTSDTQCVSWAEGNPSPTCGETVFRTKAGEPPKAAKFTEACSDTWRPLSFPCFPAPDASVLAGVADDKMLEQGYLVYTVRDDWGRESAPSAVSGLIEFNFGSTILVSGLPASYPGGATVRIYLSRATWSAGTEAALPEEASGFYLASEIVIGPTSTTVVVDYPGEALTTEDYAPAPDNLWDISDFRGGQLLGISDNALRASVPNMFHAWPKRLQLHFYGTAKRLIVGSSVGYVLTDEAPFIFRVPSGCQDTACFQGKQLDRPYPIASPVGAAMYHDTVIYPSHLGLISITGEEVKVFPQWDEESWKKMRPDQMVGCVYDGCYFFTSATGTYRLDLEAPPERALVQVSVPAIAMQAGRATNRMLYSTADGLYAWNRGIGFKTAVWRKKTGYLGGLSSAMSAIGAYGVGIYDIILYGDGVKVASFSLAGTTSDRFCPSRNHEWGSQISTQGELESLIIAGSPTKLP